MGVEGDLIGGVAPEPNPLDRSKLLPLPAPAAGDVVDDYSQS